MANKEKGLIQEHWLKLVCIVVMLLCMGATFWIISYPSPSPQATVLEAVVLTFFSTIASVLVTKIYAELGTNKSLRDQGVQIASGMMALKGELQRLSEWIAERRSTFVRSSMAPGVVDLTLEQIERTLQIFQGMTDVPLKGITGVIGDALAQYETVMGKMSILRVVESEKTTEIRREIQDSDSTLETERLETKIKTIAAETEKEISSLARSSPLPIDAPPPLRLVAEKCPYCLKNNLFEMLDKPGETKVTTCQYCHEAFNVHAASGHRFLARPLPANFSIKAKLFLINTAAWIDPSELKVLIDLVVTRDRALKGAGKTRSPSTLLADLLGDEQALARVGVTRTLLRRFMKLLFFGRTFEFPLGTTPKFSAIYVNDVNEEAVVSAFARSTVARVSQLFPLTVDRTAELSALIFGDYFPGGDETIKRAICELPVSSGGIDETKEL